MSFMSKDLSVLSYANGFTFWHYRSNDSIAAVATPGYLNTVSDLVRSGDMILVSSMSGSIAVVGFVSVTDNIQGNVMTHQVI